jgi:RNA polymerase sigma-70 factor (ECF subfamily)
VRQASDHSLLRRFRSGNQDAATQLYLRYAARLRALALAQCSPQLARRVDIDDIVQSVFCSFFDAARRGAYDVPAGDEFWKILLVIALNKVRNQEAFHRAAKRNIGRTVGGEALEQVRDEEAAYSFLQLTVADALERLPAPARGMVELRLQGYEVAQIAQQTGRSKRSVERLLQDARTRLNTIFHEAC